MLYLKLNYIVRNNNLNLIYFHFNCIVVHIIYIYYVMLMNLLFKLMIYIYEHLKSYIKQTSYDTRRVFIYLHNTYLSQFVYSKSNSIFLFY